MWEREICHCQKLSDGAVAVIMGVCVDVLVGDVQSAAMGA